MSHPNAAGEGFHLGCGGKDEESTDRRPTSVRADMEEDRYDR